MKLTQWFPHEIKPVRSGWYETFRHRKLHWWFDVNICKWRGCEDGFICADQERKWRGVQK